LDYNHHSGVFAGLWLSRVDFADPLASRADIEFYPYVGYGFRLAEDWRMDISVARYLFDGRIFGQESDYNEYSAGLHFRDLLSVRLNVADDGYHRGGTLFNGELSGRYPLALDWIASAGIGYNRASVALIESTVYWNVGLTGYYRHFAVDLRYVDSVDVAAATSSVPTIPELGEKFIGSVSVGF
jgi:uncharacterized protein (TIGR02001 family)